MASKPWAGRFGAATDRRVEQFTESISFDRRLFEHDIQGSVAHAEMLAAVGLITSDECRQIVRGLSEIRATIESGEFPFVLEREDIHMHIEAALIDKLGDVGRKLHTARSRNDQVATDAKLWTRDALDRVDTKLLSLQRSLVGAAERHRDIILPGYTHLQRAQPILAAHYFLAYVEKLARDRTRVADCRKRLNVLPLGAAALAGTSLPIDRHHVAKALGFDGVAANSLDVSSDRDFALESVFVLTAIALHLAGWAEEWVLWSTQEFSFLALPDAICTGSSIMPQKKNPDVLELIRGRSARVVGDLNTLLVLVKGLPLAYNRDLQEDKEPLFDAFDTVEACLDMAAVVVDGAKLRVDRINERLDEGFLDATTLMEHLIEQGVPQRSAHEVIGQLVAACEQRGLKRLSDLPVEEFTKAHASLGSDVKDLLGVQNAVKAFRSYGSTGAGEVAFQLLAWKQKVSVTPEEGFQVTTLPGPHCPDEVASYLFCFLRKMDFEAAQSRGKKLGLPLGLSSYGYHARPDLPRPQGEVEWSKRLAQLFGDVNILSYCEKAYPDQNGLVKKKKGKKPSCDLVCTLKNGKIIWIELKGAWRDWWGGNHKFYRSYLLHPLVAGLDPTKKHTVPLDLLRLSSLRPPEADYVAELLIGFERPDDPMDEDIKTLIELANLESWDVQTDSWISPANQNQRVRCWFWSKRSDDGWIPPSSPA